MYQKSNQKGSTLIELLIAVLVAGVVLVAVAIGVMSSIQRTAQVRYKDIATTLAQEGIETVLRDRAELGWSNFIAQYPNSTDADYCLSETTNHLESSPCNTVITKMNQDFTRVIHIVSDGVSVDVSSRVEWDAGRITPVPHVMFTQTFWQTY